MVLVCVLGRTRVGVPASIVEEVVELPLLTESEHLPSVAIGAFDYRGEVIAVASLRELCGLPPRAVAIDDVVIVLRCDGDRRLGILVDNAVELRALPANARRSADPSVAACCAAFARCGDDLLLLHDAGSLLRHVAAR